MNKLLFLAVIISCYTNIFAMQESKETDTQKRENCNNLRILRTSTGLNLQILIEEAKNGDLRSIYALREFSDSCTNKSSILMPTSREKLKKLELLDDEDRVQRSICDAFSKETQDECREFDKES